MSRRSAIRIAAALAGFGILIAAAILFTWPAIYFLRIAPQDRPLVDRAFKLAAVEARHSEAQIRRTQYPVTRRDSKRICVELRPTTALGSLYEACFDAGTSKLIVEHWIAY